MILRIVLFAPMMGLTSLFKVMRYPELAGILGCRFGGPHKYFGEMFDKPYIGDTDRELFTEDMSKAVEINRRVEIIAVAIVILLLL